jgi:plastocyanin
MFARFLTVAVLGFTLLACGDDKLDLNAEATKVASVAPSTSLALVANDLKFKEKSLVATASADITLAMDNQDSGTLHNFALYASGDAKENLYRSENFEGKASRDFRFKAPAAGVYYFRCDVHPEMNGAFIAK